MTAESAPGRTPPGTALLDLRIVPAALLAWGCAAVGVLVPARAAPLVCVAAVVGLAVVAGVAVRGASQAHLPDRTSGLVVVALVAVCAGLAALAAASAQVALRGAGELAGLTAERAVVTVEGRVLAEPRPWTPRSFGADDESGGEPGSIVRLAVSAVDGRGHASGAAGEAVVLGGGEWSHVAPGSVVRAQGRLGPTDPGDRAVALLRPMGAPILVTPAQPAAALITAMRDGVREASAGLPPDQAGLVPGVAVGDTSRMPPALDEAMRTTSLVHITAVSGGHFAIIGATVLLVATAVGLRRRPRAVVTACAMAGFVALVGLEPAVLRAAAMGAVGVLALTLGRPAAAMPALSTAVVVLVLVDPWTARSIGFVLSVVATAGLVLGVAPIAGWLGRVMPRGPAHLLAVPIAAQAACGPVLVLLDPSLATYAVPANVLAAPALVPATVLGCLAAVVHPAWPALAGVLATGAGWASWWIAEVAHLCAALPGARLPWAEGAGGAALLALATAAALAAAALVGRRAGRAPRVVAACVALAVGLGAAVAAPALRDGLGTRWPGLASTGRWDVVACDVGQGDMLVVRSGEDSAVVVDVGGAGEGAAACLARLGVRSIELLVLSHFHADHVGGVAEVLDAGVEVEQALVSPYAEPAANAATVRSLLAGAGVPVQGASAASTPAGQAGEVAWRVLWPRGEGEPLLDANDASVVVRLERAGAVVLALGDLGEDAQGSLLRSTRATGGRELAAHLVKMAHHGSAGQTEPLARAVGAAVALVGVGDGNAYGHPRAEAIDLYRAAGAAVLRTDLCGDVVLAIAGADLLQRGGCRAAP